MRERPPDLEDRLYDALAVWGIHAVALNHLPLGSGDHHWSATDTSGRRWFATAADLAHKPFLGPDPASVRRGLTRAMDTAARLHDDEGLGFVVAPLRTPGDDTVVPVGDRYALSVFPFVDGTSGDFGGELSADRRARVLDVLAQLHRRDPGDAPAVPAGLPGRDRLAALLDHPAGTGDGGPHAAPTAELLAGYAGVLRERLAEFDHGARALAGAAAVLTHGEPHPGNLLWRGGRPLLVDWDTVGLAVPERDLWLVTDDPGELARYARVSGHEPDPALMDLYRLRWDLQDVVEFVDWFSAPHRGGPDTEQAWRDLVFVVERLGDGARSSAL
ncbi:MULTISPECIES: phosphotransferase [Nocardiopsis]|uniref:Phosphotransferase n=1 Tax=Nocardiopsis sinuspersici TaxID=501010 RepID=A0A1V3BXY6_9ACTN|nr:MULTISPECIES: phosphotransferase [Nocardiopsis]OOC53308.1 phosphotransferase [Nocardiopsis sinuspersici]